MPASVEMTPEQVTAIADLKKLVAEHGTRAAAVTAFVNEVGSKDKDLLPRLLEIVRTSEAASPTGETPPPAVPPAADLGAGVNATPTPFLDPLLKRGTQAVVGAAVTGLAAQADELRNAFQAADGFGSSFLGLVSVTSVRGLLLAAGAMGVVGGLANGVLSKHFFAWPAVLLCNGRRVYFPGVIGTGLLAFLASAGVAFLAHRAGLPGSAAVADRGVNWLSWPVVVLSLGTGFGVGRLLTDLRDRGLVAAATTRPAGEQGAGRSLFDRLWTTLASSLPTAGRAKTVGDRLKGLGVPAAFVMIGAAVAGVARQGTGEKLGVWFTDDPVAAKVADPHFPPSFPADEWVNGKLFHWDNGRFAELAVPVAPTEISLDAKGLGQWGTRGRFRSAWRGEYAEQYYVDAGLMMDDQHLYVGAHVGDPYPLRAKKLVSPNKDGNWEGGAIQLRLATDVDRNGTIADDYPPERLFHLTLWHKDGKSYLHVANGLGFKVDVKPLEDREGGFDARYELDADGRGYVAKAKVPWSLVGLAAAPYGKTLGFCWETTWADASGTVCISKMTDFLNTPVLNRLRLERKDLDIRPGNLSYTNPSIWGRAVCAPHK